MSVEQQIHTAAAEAVAPGSRVSRAQPYRRHPSPFPVKLELSTADGLIECVVKTASAHASRISVEATALIVMEQIGADAPRVLAGPQLHPEIVAAYVAKYATKAAGDIAPAGNAHLSRLRGVVAELALRARVNQLGNRDGQDGQDGGEDAYRGWHRWVDTLGFRGHFSTKSRRYSTTFGRLRQARRDHAAHRSTPDRAGQPAHEVVGDADPVEDESILIVGSWRFNGMGWLTSGDATLAAASAARARDD